MLKKSILFFTGFTCAIFLNGCATTPKGNNPEIQSLKNQVLALESQIQAKDEEIKNLQESVNKGQEERVSVTKKSAIPEAKKHPSIKQIQTALKNAGYYLGSVDGRPGKQTREAIQAFQKANNLKPDGKVGKETWNLLKKYLEQKVK